MAEHKFHRWNYGICMACNLDGRKVFTAVPSCPGAPPVNDTGRERLTTYAQLQAQVASHIASQPSLYEQVVQAQRQWAKGMMGALYPVKPPEPQADGATAPNKHIWNGRVCDACGLTTYSAKSPVCLPAKPPGKAPEHVPSIGHAMRQTARPVTLCGALWRYRP